MTHMQELALEFIELHKVLRAHCLCLCRCPWMASHLRHVYCTVQLDVICRCAEGMLDLTVSVTECAHRGDDNTAGMFGAVNDYVVIRFTSFPRDAELQAHQGL